MCAYIYAIHEDQKTKYNSQFPTCIMWLLEIEPRMSMMTNAFTH